MKNVKKTIVWYSFLLLYDIAFNGKFLEIFYMYNSYLFKHDYCEGSSEKGQMKVNFSQTWQDGRILNYFFFFF